MYLAVMQDFLEKIRDAHNDILVFVLFAGCLGVLLYMYPREGQFKFEYAEGRVWQYEDLFAPNDLQIDRLEEEIKADQDAIRNEQAPVYVVDASLVDQKIAQFEKALAKQWPEREQGVIEDLLTSERRDSLKMVEQLTIGAKVINDLYSSGIIDLAQQHEEMGRTDGLLVKNGGTSRSVERQDLYTISEAVLESNRTLNRNPKAEADFLQPIIQQCLAYNLSYDAEATERFVENRLQTVVRTAGNLSAGELIIRKGQLVGKDELRVLNSLESDYENEAGKGRSWWIILLGQALLISLGLVAMVIIIKMLQPEILESPSRITFIILLVLLMALTVKIALEVPTLSIFLAPLCMLPIVIRTFYDARLAILLHVVNVFMLSFIVPSAFEFVFLQIFAGILLLYGMRSLARRSQFFNAALVIFFSYSATYLGLNIIQEGNFEGIHLTNYAWFGGNAVLSMLAFPLIYFIERSFGFVSEVSLLEISDSNNVLLRELSEKAPGTFQHTLQVSNLAEEAIRAIGGNVLLVRAGALYHDIGKMEAPQYFTENQHGINPHDDLGYEESAGIIIMHVIKGIELARKHRLPEEIIDFIRTHHGTTRTEYFYRKAVEEQGKDNVDIAKFTYPGPKPFSRETAVLMMADTVEAASRSLTNYSEENLEALIEGLIGHQQSMGQFENASITFKEITTVKKVFLRKLKNIYHARIAYPDRKE